MENNLFQNCISRNLRILGKIMILGGRLDSPILKDVAWLKDGHLMFQIGDSSNREPTNFPHSRSASRRPFNQPNFTNKGIAGAKN